MRRWPLYITVFALALRLATLNWSLLWYDEAYTAIIVKRPFFEMLKAIAGDTHPPLWYLFEWVTVRLFGSSELALRLPAAMFSSLAVLESYFLARKLSGDNAARWASGVMALLPGQIYYGQEARMYSLLTVLVLFGARAVLDKRWLRLGLAAALIVYTQNLGAIYVALLAAWGLWQSKGRAFKYLTVAGLAYAPWLPTLWGQLTAYNTGFWLPPMGNAGGALYWLSFTTVFSRLPDWLSIHGVVLAFGTTVIAAFTLRNQFVKLAPLFGLAFAPPLLLTLISALWRPVLLDRALLPSGAAVGMLWGIAATELPSWGKKVYAAFALPVIVLIVLSYYIDPTRQRARFDPVVNLIKASWQEGDAIYHLSLSSYIGYDYLLPDLPAFVLPDAGNLAASLSEQTKEGFGIKEHEALISDIEAGHYRRVWLFITESPVSSQFEMAQSRQILAAYPVIEHWQVLHRDLVDFRIALIDLSPESCPAICRAENNWCHPTPKPCTDTWCDPAVYRCEVGR